MKKKIILSVIIIIIAALTATCLLGCGSDYTALNNMCKETYSQIVLQIKTTTNGETLTDNFTVKNNGSVSKIDYSIERLTEISLDEIPKDYKTETVGTVIVENGKITQNDNQISEEIASLRKVGFSFYSNYFVSPKWTSGQFSATVKDPAQFFDVEEFVCTNMHVTVKYSSSLKSMVITYKSAKGSTVEMRYTFTK